MKIKLSFWRVVGIFVILVVLWQLILHFSEQLQKLGVILIIVFLVILGLYGLFVFIFDPQKPKEIKI